MEYKKAKVFISYVREDRDKALLLFSRLKNLGFDPWIDEKKLLPGQNWKVQIKESIILSDFFLACLSNNSVSKVGFFQSELKEGFEILKQYPSRNIFFIPVRFDDCEIPFEISDYHWVNLFEVNGLENLVKSLKHEWKQRGFEWQPQGDIDLNAPLYNGTEENPFDNVMAFVRHIVFLRKDKNLDELTTIYKEGLEKFHESSDKGIIHYVWSATLRSFAKKYKNPSLYEKAIIAALKATKLAPDNADSWLECAQAYRDSGSIAKAREYYERCLKVDPDKDECLTSYAMLLQRHCDNNDSACQEKIIQLLEHLIKIRPHDIMSHDVLGIKYLFQRRDFEKANEHLSQIRDKIEKSAFGKKQKSIMLFHQGQYFEAVGDLKSALKYFETSFSVSPHPNCGRRIEALKRRLSE